MSKNTLPADPSIIQCEPPAAGAASAPRPVAKHVTPHAIHHVAHPVSAAIKAMSKAKTHTAAAKRKPVAANCDEEVALNPAYDPVRHPAGKVVGVWGTAFVKTPDGDVHVLNVGDVIHRGDVVMTTQNGYIQLESDGTRLARIPGSDLLADAGQEIDIAPAAGLTGGDGSFYPDALYVSPGGETVAPTGPLTIAPTNPAAPLTDGRDAILGTQAAAASTLIQPSLTTGGITVSEAGSTAAGSFAVSAPNGLQSVTIGTTTLSAAQLAGLSSSSPLVVNTDVGTVQVTGYDSNTGVVSFNFSPVTVHNTNGAAASTTIPVSVTDSNGFTASGFETLTVTDTGPVAVADTNSITEDFEPITVSNGLISSTRTGESDTLNVDTPITVTGIVSGTAASASGNIGSTISGQYGTLTVNSAGAYTYTLNNTNSAVNALNVGQTLKDVFTYTITDADGSTSTSTLTITVNGTDDASVLKPDARTEPEDTVVVGNVLTNDTDVDSTLAVASFSIGGTKYTVGQTATIAGVGTITINADGSYTFSPASHWNGTVPEVTYTTNTGSASTLDITITPVDSPVTLTVVDNNASATGQDTVWEAGLVTPSDSSHPATASGVINVSAPDGLASIAVGSTLITPTQLAALSTSPITVTSSAGTLVLTGYNATTGDLSYTYTLKSAQSQPNATESTDTFSLTVKDVDGSSASGSLVVRIVDDTPTAKNDANTVTEGDTVAATGNVYSSGNSHDVADSIGADTATNPVTAKVYTGLYGTLTLNADGSYAYVLDNTNAAVKALVPGQTLTDSFSYTITDSDGDTATAALNVTINGVNHPVTLTVVDNNASATGQDTVWEAGLVTPSDSSHPATASGVITVSAPDGLDSITVGSTQVTAAQLAALSTTPITITSSTGSTLVLTGYNATTGDLSYTYTLKSAQSQPNATESIDTFSLTVKDADGSSASGSLVVRIVDDTPTAKNDANTVTEGDTVAATGNVYSSGNSHDVADSIGADTAANPVTAKVYTGLYGTLTLNADGSYAYVLDNTNAAVKALVPGQTLTDSFSYTITDSDGDTATAALNVTINGVDHPVTLTVVDNNASATGQDTVWEAGLVTPSDSSHPATASGVINVSAPDGLASIAVGSTLITPTQLAALSTSPITVTSSAGTLVLTGYNATTGDLSYTYTLKSAQSQPNATESTDTFSLTVKDADGSSASGSLVVRIVDDTPTAKNDANTVTEGDTVAATGNVYSSGNSHDVADSIGADVRANPVTAGVFTGKYGTLTLNADGSYAYVLDNTNAAVKALVPGKTLTDSFNYTITDSDGDTATAALNVTINGLDHPVTLTVVDNNASATGQDTVWEAGLVTPSDSSHPATASGVITVSAPDGLASITVGSTQVTAAQLAALSSTPVTITSSTGSTLVLTGYNATTGDLSYTYTLKSAQSQPNATESTDTFSLTVKDADGSSASGSLVVRIVDDTPTARNDVASIVEDDTAAATGNVFTSGNNHDVADSIGADVRANPVVLSNTTSADHDTYKGTYGTLDLYADGHYAYHLDNSLTAVQALAGGQVVTESFAYTIQDADGDTSSATLSVQITGTNDAPTVLSIDAPTHISEEGLSNGIADTTGSPDTTNSVTTTGSVHFTDIDGTIANVQWNTSAIGTYTSHGIPLTWVVDSSSPLVLHGFTSETQVVTATLVPGSTNGDYTYTVTLNGPLDHPTANVEDALTLSLGIKVTDNSNASSTSTLNVVVEDDSPASVTHNIDIATTNTNLLVTLDVSGSMATPVGSSGQTRLEIAVASLKTLIDSYDNVGDVKVQLVIFDTTAKKESTVWVSATEAKAELDSILSTYDTYGNRWTNYHDALTQTMDAFNNSGKLDHAQNVVYFISDGEPNVLSNGNIDWATGYSPLSTTEQQQWINFVDSNSVDSFAVGIAATDTSSSGKFYTALDPLAYDGTIQTDTAPIMMADATGLNSALQSTVPSNVSGSLFSGSLGTSSSAVFGADGGHLQSVTFDGVVHTADFTVTATDGTTFSVKFSDGSYTYNTSGTSSTSATHAVTYTLVDNDGDTAQSTLTFHNGVTTGTSGDDYLIGSLGPDTLSGGAGNDTIMGGAGNDIIIGGAGNDTLTGGLGSDTFKWNLADATTTAKDVITDFNTASASAGGDILDLRDLLSGYSGSLDQHLDFALSTSGSVTSTTIHVTNTPTAVDQTIVLTGVDLYSSLGLTSGSGDAAVITALVQQGKLLVDQHS